MERNYAINIEKILVAYNALRDYRNAPSNNDSKELDILWNAKQDMNLDELTVYYELVQIAYLQGREDGWKFAWKDYDGENA